MSNSAVVFRPTSENEASLVKSLLESYDIPVTLSSEHLLSTVYPMFIGDLTLSVPEELTGAVSFLAASLYLSLR